MTPAERAQRDYAALVGLIVAGSVGLEGRWISVALLGAGLLVAAMAPAAVRRAFVPIVVVLVIFTITAWSVHLGQA